jgi:hypothetical protein
MDNSDNVIPLFREDPRDERRQWMIETWEALYLKHDQTLADPKTAASLHVAMKMVALLLDGALAHEAIDASQHEMLLGIVHTGHAAAGKLKS